MRERRKRTFDATPDPKRLVAVGDCARDGSLIAGSDAVEGGARRGRAGRLAAEGAAGAGGEGVRDAQHKGSFFLRYSVK
jgi:hypothetical protein